MISENRLKKYDCSTVHYASGDFIYEENAICYGYFQIISGKVKLNNYSEDGKEFIQNTFGASQGFGEVLLFVNKKYPTNAIALTDCNIVQIPAKEFFMLLNEHPEYALEIIKNLSQRLYYKMIMPQHISQNSAFCDSLNNWF